MTHTLSDSYPPTLPLSDGAADRCGSPTPITMTLREAAGSSGLSVRTLQRLADAGDLATMKVRGRRLVNVASLRALVSGEAA